MNIGELFVKLGIQGGDKTLGTLKENQKAFKGTASMALEAKAAILGAVYALQSLFRSSNALGSDLTNFNATLGVSAKTLQQYQYAARQVGVDNKAVEQSFRTLQSAMTKTLMGKPGPEGLARVAQLTGDLTPDDLLEFSKAPEKLLQRLQDYAAKEKDAGFRNEVLKTFGLGDDMIAALNRQAFRPEILQKAPTYSNGEIANLDKANVAWANLGNQIEMAVGKFNAKYGLDIVKSISEITGEVVKLADALVLLSDKLKLFEALKNVVNAVTFISNTGSTTLDLINGKAPTAEKAKTMNKDADKFLSENDLISTIVTALFGKDRSSERMDMMQKALQKARSGYEATPEGAVLNEPKAKPNAGAPVKTPAREEPSAGKDLLKILPSLLPRPAETAAPRMPPAASSNTTSQTQNITVNQTLKFSGAASDPSVAKRVQADAVQKAFRQISAQTRSN